MRHIHFKFRNAVGLSVEPAVTNTKRPIVIIDSDDALEEDIVLTAAEAIRFGEALVRCGENARVAAFLAKRSKKVKK